MSKNTDTTSKLDAAIAQAKSRRIAKKKASGAATDEATETATEASDAPTAPKRARLTPEQRAERDAQREQERAEKRAAREAARAAKRAEREANRKPAHMTKVEKAAARLPSMSEELAGEFNRLVAGFSVTDMATLVQHMELFVRQERTRQALERKLEAGQTVQIISGDPRFVGAFGKVVKAQRIRCYVQVPGVEKPVYLFTSDVTVLDAGEAEAVDTAEESTDTAVAV